MSYTTILVYIDPESKSEQLLRFAAELADEFNATLIGLSALAVRPPFVAEEIVMEGVTEAEVTTKLEIAERRFRHVTGGNHRKIEWRPVVDYPTDALAAEARSADLVVIAQRATGGDVYSTLDRAGVILKVGRPVLVVPQGVSSLRAEHVVIGWKDVREARRAVYDALPFLRKSRPVRIVEICTSDKKETTWKHVEDVARYLSRHEIETESEVIVSSDDSDGKQLLQFAKDKGADLLVTGAYGHSRLGEWIFGGMTRDLLALSPIPCLMSH
jgi:nucleotide-binding universal stress UspA family protein